MGKNNKQRRAAKAKFKTRARSGQPGPSRDAGAQTAGGGRRPPSMDPPLFTPEELARNLLFLCADAQRRGDGVLDDGLVRLTTMSSSVVHREAEKLLLSQVAAAWTGGWQPAELYRQGRLGCGTAPAGRLVGWAIAVDHAGRRATTLDPRWRDQVDGLGLPHVTGRVGWVGCWADDEGIDRPETVAAIVDVLAEVLQLPRLDPILPPPGTGGGPTAEPPSSGAVGAEHDPVLVRIRALLAKAESTTYEAEAVAFTAKAQEIMTRHAIDAAIVHARGGEPNEQPIVVRLPIDAPYLDAKSLLLQVVAAAGRCRTVFHDGLAMSAVIGFRDDLAAVEVLFTSLLIQAQTAMAESAKGAPVGSRSRSSSFRSAFLAGYTQRIGERLREINDAVLAEAEEERGDAFLPVLRSRSAAVDDLVADQFGPLESSAVRRGYDRAGMSMGMFAADQAELARGDLAESAAPV